MAKYNDDADGKITFNLNNQKSRNFKPLIILGVLAFCGVFCCVCGVFVTGLLSRTTTNENSDANDTITSVSNEDSTAKTTIHKESNSNTSNNQNFNNITSNSNIPNDAIRLGNHAYYGYSMGMSWSDAEEYCISLGGHLISINTSDEQNVALDIAKKIKKDNIWTGGYFSNNKWNWTDSSSFSYSNWDSREVYNDLTSEWISFDQPDNYSGDEYYIRFVSRDIDYPENNWWANEGKWNDTAPNGDSDAPLTSFGFICEWTE